MDRDHDFLLNFNRKKDLVKKRNDCANHLHLYRALLKGFDFCEMV